MSRQREPTSYHLEKYKIPNTNLVLFLIFELTLSRLDYTKFEMYRPQSNILANIQCRSRQTFVPIIETRFGIVC